MTTMDERDLREQLVRAVGMIDPVAPPLDALRVRATKRTRIRRTGGVLVALASMAAIVVAVVAVVPGSEGKRALKSVGIPTRESLVTYAQRHGALRITGPYESSDGYFGAFTTKAGLAVASYHSDHWAASGRTVTKLGGGRYISHVRFAFPLRGSGLMNEPPPSIYLRTLGGDVSYYGSVLRLSGGAWQPATFIGCGHRGLCPAGTSEPYLHSKSYGYDSVANNCRPYCAAGTDYRISWAWSERHLHFEAIKVVKLAL